MNTNQLKKFAQAARKKLLEQVRAKLEYVLNNDTPELREKASVVNRLKAEVDRLGKQQIIDKIAYTWFNRFVALRFMDINGYQPLGINIVTALPGQVSPQILQEAMAGNIAGELNVDKQKVFGLLDGKIKSTNAENDAYRLLLIAACNHLHRIFPFLFEQIDDHTELLLPDDLTSQFSLLHDVVEGITEEDGKQVECIGWLYQFYISERKDEVFASKEKVKKEDIPAATQLFTPRWIVEYMVQNTVGKLWMMNHPGSTLRQHMPYYIESEATKTGDYLKITSPEELTLLDQACGSGHILVYGFELLYRIYEEQGYNTSEIPALIIKHNLHGMEIDERAAQLSSLAILMKAREYQARLFKKAEVPVPNIICYEDLALTTDAIKQAFSSADIKLSSELLHDLTNMQQATNLGSLIIPHTGPQELETFKEQLGKAIPGADLYNRPNLEQIAKAIDTLIALSTKHCCVVDNPPYMGGNMNKDLSDFIRINYPLAKADLFSCFIDRGISTLKNKGFCGMVTMESWMFLSSFEEFRKQLITNTTIHSVAHFGWHVMRIAFGTVAFIIEKGAPRKEFLGTYSYLEYENIDKTTGKPYMFPVNNSRFRRLPQNTFFKIPGVVIGYWLSDNTVENFTKGVALKEVGDTRQGMATSNNARFIKLWQEVPYNNIGFYKKSHIQAKESFLRWFPYNKGGGFRKWYGNSEYVVNWQNDGIELLAHASSLYGSPTRTIKSISEYFKPCLSWSKVTAGKFSVRYYPEGYLFDVAGCCIFIKDEKWFSILSAFLNSKVSAKMLEVLSPTLNYEAGVIAKLPVIEPSQELISDKCIAMSRSDWNSRETSWDFKLNELVRISGQDLEETYDLYQQYWSNKFHQLRQNEEEINQQFIDIYGLQDELTPDVPLEDITILQQEAYIEDNNLVFNASEVFAQFISYSVGCMFGRYSLDKEGLILASQGETMQDYFNKTERTKETASFAPDADNIIPVLDDEWFDDDIVACFHQFLKVSFGEKHFRKNLAFIEEQLGKDIRKYFVKDFYTDHIQRYKKRPIYWMFSSPKGHFNVLVYLHRYTPDTLNNILNNYLRQFIEKLRNRTEHLKQVEVSGSAAEKTRATKEIEKISLMLADCLDYERNILYPLAASRISIDLDNGVLVNYNCFGKAVKEVKGLNDTKTKNEVRKFDWIDTAMIQ